MNNTPAASPHSPPAPAFVPGPVPAEAAGQRLGQNHRIAWSSIVMLLGTGLFVVGTPMTDIFLLLGGCGLISVITLTAMAGGRQLTEGLIEAAVRAAVGGRP